MMDNTMLPKRKHPRLKNYDYSQNGVYFITICTFEKRKIFSSISMGCDGLELSQLSVLGETAAKQIENIPERFSNVFVDNYVIMPNHIHILLAISNEVNDKEPRPTVSDIICAFKSLTANECRKLDPTTKIFQTSFHDHIVRNEKEYQQIWNYIDSNIQRWLDDCFYAD